MNHRKYFDARMFKLPDPRTADPSGLVIETPKLTPELVLEAYVRGMFPWSEKPARWFSPDPRAVFVREHVRLPSRLGRMVRQGNFHVTFDTAFEDVMRGCRSAHAHEGEWLGDEFIESYGILHKAGYAHSVEVWQNEALVGGLYGIQIGAMFAGESMFYRASNASKVAFAALMAMVEHLGIWFVDAQAANDHTEKLGVVWVTRNDFLKALQQAVHTETPGGPGRWMGHAELYAERYAIRS